MIRRIIFFLCIGSAIGSAQEMDTMFISLRTGSIISYADVSVNAISFSGIQGKDTLNVNLKSGLVDQLSISLIDHISFSNVHSIDSISIGFKTGITKSYAVSLLSKLTFVDWDKSAPYIVSGKNELTFPNTIKGDSTSLIIVVKDSSVTPLTISSINIASPTFSVDQATPFIINGNDSIQLIVRFKPKMFGSIVDTLKIVSDGGNSSIVLYGNSPYPNFISNVNSLSFGMVAKNTSKQLGVSLFNNSINPLTIDSIYTKTSFFNVDKISGTVGADSMSLIVSFTPITHGSFIDTLFIRNNSQVSLVKIPLFGETPQPIIVVIDTMIVFTDTKLSDSVSKYITIQNKSISPLTMHSVSVGTNAFTIDSIYIEPISGIPSEEGFNSKLLSKYSFPIVIKDSFIVRVIFIPDHYGSHNDTLTIISDGGTKKIALCGKSSYPVITANITGIDWSLVSKGKIHTKELLLTNSSINSLNIDSIYTKSKQFIANKEQGNISTNETLSVLIEFKPDTFAVFNDTVYVRNNSENDLLKISLRGESPIPVLIFSPNIYRKDSIAVGDSSTQLFVIKNNSPNDLSYDSMYYSSNSFIIRGITSGTIKSNDSSLITIVFKPTMYGEYSDTIVVSSLGSITRIPLFGSSPFPQMSYTTSFDFGIVRITHSELRKLVIKNTSINTLRIDSMKHKSDVFALQKMISTVFVTKKDSANIDITFKPDSAKSYSDTVIIFNNSLTNPVKVSMNGNGTLTSITFNSEILPTRFMLHQNYPNPFNPTTVLQYDLPNRSSVSLKIYNLLGQQVAQLVAREQEAGWYFVQWNAQVSTGQYFYRIEAVDVSDPKNRFVQVKKMLYLK